MGGLVRGGVEHLASARQGGVALDAVAAGWNDAFPVGVLRNAEGAVGGVLVRGAAVLAGVVDDGEDAGCGGGEGGACLVHLFGDGGCGARVGAVGEDGLGGEGGGGGEERVEDEGAGGSQGFVARGIDVGD